jgi:hypothetical protein
MAILSAHETSDGNRASIINTKNVVVRSTVFLHCSICKYTLTSDGKMHSYVAHVSISRRILCLPLGVASCCASIQLVPYDAVNRNKVSIRQLPLFIFSHSLHVSAPTGHLQVRYTIRCFQGLFLLQRIRCTYTT